MNGLIHLISLCLGEVKLLQLRANPNTLEGKEGEGKRRGKTGKEGADETIMAHAKTLIHYEEEGKRNLRRLKRIPPTARSS